MEKEIILATISNLVDPEEEEEIMEPEEEEEDDYMCPGCDLPFGDCECIIK